MDKISVFFFTLDYSVSAIEDFSCKSLHSRTRLSVFFPLQGPRIFKSMPFQKSAVTTHTNKPITITIAYVLALTKDVFTCTEKLKTRTVVLCE